MTTSPWTVSDLIAYLQSLSTDSDPLVVLVNPVNRGESLTHRNVDDFVQVQTVDGVPFVEFYTA